MQAWRITQERHVTRAFDGEGARLFGGRWNSPGIAVVYLSRFVSTAILEILVHVANPIGLANHVSIGVEIPDDVSIEKIKRLPRNWRESPPSAQTQALGDEWCRSGRSALLYVPSAVLSDAHSDEWNLLVNPRHSDWAFVQIRKPSTLNFNPRLR